MSHMVTIGMRIMNMRKEKGFYIGVEGWWVELVSNGFKRISGAILESR